MVFLPAKVKANEVTSGWKAEPKQPKLPSSGCGTPEGRRFLLHRAGDGLKSPKADLWAQEHSGGTGGGGDAWVGRDRPDLPHLRYLCTRPGEQQPPHQQLSGERALLSDHPLVMQPCLPGHQGQQRAHAVVEVLLPAAVLYRHCPVWGMASGEATTCTTHRSPHKTHGRGITAVADLQPSHMGLWRTPGTLALSKILT